jgi:hypothetical protein
MKLSLGAVYDEALGVYRLLMRRSILTAALVYAVVDAANTANDRVSTTGLRITLGLLSFVLIMAGPVLVQGALVEIVRNVHEGKRPEQVTTLYRAAGRRFWSLLWASIVYGVGVIVGLVLLIVPGLVVAARWCLLAPLVMLEGESVGPARERSSALVRGQTVTVVVIVVLTFVLTDSVFLPLAFLDPHWAVRYVVSVAWSSLMAPFGAHVLTVLYYRLTQPDRPVIHESVWHWPSVWAGPTAED